MKIILKSVGKKYNYDWIFNHLNFTFELGKSYALLGQNGCGKSTLIQIIAGSIIPSAGEVTYIKNGKNIDPDIFFKHISFAAPYMELPEEMTLTELLQFHSGFKNCIKNFTLQEIINSSGIKNYATRQIKFYSSGMKQRVKLLMALLFESDIILLDEPTTNLDEQGVQWWKNLMLQHSKNRIVIIASNMEREYENCDFKIMMTDYK